MTLPAICLDTLLFFGLVFGLGLPWTAGSRRFCPMEKLTLGAVGGVLLIYLAAWMIYLAKLPVIAFLVLPATAMLGVALRWRKLGDLFQDATVRPATAALAVFAAWCLGWLALVHSYSGGEWSADWLEHFQRAQFFLAHHPLDEKFNAIYSLTARPPLANLVVGAGMALGGASFGDFQVFSTLFSSLLLLPALQLGRSLSKETGPNPALPAALMFSPFVIQNATFPWTKLPCAFLVLGAAAFYVRGLDDAGAVRRHIAFVAMAGAILAHYSAVPYALAFVVLHLFFLVKTRRLQAAIGEIAVQAVVAGALLATWFAWALSHYGPGGTFLSNSTVTADAGLAWVSRLFLRLHVLFVTLVPHPLRAADYAPLAQMNRAGFLRDYFFTIYQTALPGAFGLAGAVWVAARIRLGKPEDWRPRPLWFWTGLSGIVFILGIATISWPDRWGVAHINFCALVLMVTVWLSTMWPRMPPAWRAGWIAALAADGVLGIGLQFYVEATATLAPADATALFHHTPLPYSVVATKNLMLKQFFHLHFVADGGPSPRLLAAFLGALAFLAIRAAWRAGGPAATDR